MLLFRRALTVALLGLGALGLITLLRRARRPNRLFLYSSQTEQESAGHQTSSAVAAVATIGPNRFQIESSFPFGDWSTVASAANGSSKWLFFHNRNDGSAETGSVDRNFRYHRKRFYPPGSFLDWPYVFAVVNGLGQLLLLGYDGHGGMIVGFAEVLDDGEFVEWWRTVLPATNAPDFNGCAIVGLPRSHAWFRSDVKEGTPAGGTTYIFDVKHAQILSSRKSPVEWHGIGVDKDLVYFFNSFESKAEICLIDADQQLVPVKNLYIDPDLVANPHQCVASTPGAHLGYSFRKPEAAVQVLSRDGFPVTHKVNDLAGYWERIVPC